MMRSYKEGLFDLPANNLIGNALSKANNLLSAAGGTQMHSLADKSVTRKEMEHSRRATKNSMDNLRKFTKDNQQLHNFTRWLAIKRRLHDVRRSALASSFWSLLGLALAIAEHESYTNGQFDQAKGVWLKEPNSPAMVSGPTRIVIWIANALVMYYTVMYYVRLLDLAKVMDAVGRSTQIWQTWSLFPLLVELILHVISPIPYYSKRITHYTYATGQSWERSVDYYLVSIMYLRIYQTARLYSALQTVYSFRAIQSLIYFKADSAPFEYAIKATISTMDAWGFLAMCFLLIAVFGGLFIAASEKFLPGCREDLCDQSNGVWNAFITATTVGYGDFAAASIAGRLMAMCVAFSGNMVGNMLTVALERYTQDMPKVEVAAYLRVNFRREYEDARVKACRYIYLNLVLAKMARTGAPFVTMNNKPVDKRKIFHMRINAAADLRDAIRRLKEKERTKMLDEEVNTVYSRYSQEYQRLFSLVRVAVALVEEINELLMRCTASEFVSQTVKNCVRHLRQKVRAIGNKQIGILVALLQGAEGTEGVEVRDYRKRHSGATGAPPNTGGSSGPGGGGSDGAG